MAGHRNIHIYRTRAKITTSNQLWPGKRRKNKMVYLRSRDSGISSAFSLTHSIGIKYEMSNESRKKNREKIVRECRRAPHVMINTLYCLLAWRCCSLLVRVLLAFRWWLSFASFCNSCTTYFDCRICVCASFIGILATAALINASSILHTYINCTNLIEPDNLLRERGTDLDCGASSTLQRARCSVCVSWTTTTTPIKNEKYVAFPRQADQLLQSIFSVLASHQWQIEQIYTWERWKQRGDVRQRTKRIIHFSGVWAHFSWDY